MLISFIRPKSIYGRFYYNLLIGYLVIGLIGCSTPPRVEKPPASIARAMETRSFSGNLKTVLKASINSLQDMDYTIEVLNSDVGLITASRTTESKKAKLASEAPQEGMTDSEKACLTIGAIAIIAVIAAAIFDGDDNNSGNNIYTGGGNDNGPDGPMIYRYRVTINLTELDEKETNVRVSASGEVEQDGKILSTGGVHEPEFFQKFFTGMNQGLFLDQNRPIKQ